MYHSFVYPFIPQRIFVIIQMLVMVAEYLHVFNTTEGFPGGACGKEPTCQCKRCKRCRFDPWVWKIPWRRAQQPTPIFFPGKFHGRRSLVGYSPWGHKESDTTDHTDFTWGTLETPKATRNYSFALQSNLGLFHKQRHTQSHTNSC